MKGKLFKAYTTELGEIVFNSSKDDVKKLLEEKNITYDETNRTIIAYSGKDNEDILAYFIFTEDLNKILLFDLCNLTLEWLDLDGIIYSADDLKNQDMFASVNKVMCDSKNDFVDLDKHLNCVGCTAGVARDHCLGAGEIYHTIYLDESVITYIDFGQVNDNKMFCIENDHGKEVDYQKIVDEEMNL